MAIDRGPWNALVDDDGSNLVGIDLEQGGDQDRDSRSRSMRPSSRRSMGRATPGDGSGAGLVHRDGRPDDAICKIGRIVIVLAACGVPGDGAGINAIIDRTAVS